MSDVTHVRTERVRAFIAWLDTVEHPHWVQPGFADFADLTEAERLDAARILRLRARAVFAHADKLKGAPAENDCPPVTVMTEGQSIAVGANAGASYPLAGAAGKSAVKAAQRRLEKRGSHREHWGRKIAYRGSTGRIWAFDGKRGRVLEMLATMGQGVTQWDCLPWHTRLGASVHAMREEGLSIETVREGEYRHARYILRTPGRLLIQANNSQEPVTLHRKTP